jgi:hypothetical protein
MLDMSGAVGEEDLTSQTWTLIELTVDIDDVLNTVRKTLWVQ